MKSRTNQTLLFLLFFGAIFVVSLNAWLAYRAINAMGQTESSVTHTWRVLNAIEHVLSSMKDAETSSRGYLLTGDESYLDPYKQAKSDIPVELSQLQELTHDSPVQQSRILEMRALTEQRIRILEDGIAERASGDTESVRQLVLNDTGKIEMDHLRNLGATMQDTEYNELVHRTAATISARRRANTMLLSASILDVVLLVLLFLSLRRERHARQQAEDSASEVQTLNTELEERVRLRTAELEAANRELEAFSYSVSHDLRAPLRSVDGISVALEEDYGEQLTDEARDFLRRIRAGVQKMGRLIDSLLQLSRITRAELTREHVNLSQLAEDVAADLRQQNTSRHILFQIEPDMTADADPRLLRIAFENLLGNAVKFTAKNDPAIIQVGQDHHTKEYYVRDNGAGFDMQYAGKLFIAFQRLHGDRDFQGSGIGLATVSRVIRRHGGKISAEGEVDHGATFRFTLG